MGGAYPPRKDNEMELIKFYDLLLDEYITLDGEDIANIWCDEEMEIFVIENNDGVCFECLAYSTFMK